MYRYTVIGIHNSGLGLILHLAADSAKDALKEFESRDVGVALAILSGFHDNLVPRNIWPGSSPPRFPAKE